MPSAMDSDNMRKGDVNMELTILNNKITGVCKGCDVFEEVAVLNLTSGLCRECDNKGA